MKASLPKLVAHRGYTLHYPENTLLALRAAVDAGAHYLEFDIQLSKDKEPVLFHDRDLQRMCGQSGAVHDYTLAELKGFSVSQFEKFGYRFVGNPITTLQEAVMYLAEQPAVFAFVELKRLSLQTFGIDTVLDTVLPLLEPIQQRAIIISYSLEALRATRERSHYPIGAVFDDWRERKQLLIRTLQPEFLFTDIDLLPRFGRLKHTQSQLAVYECTDPQQAVKVHRRGVDMVETFAIGEMLNHFKLHAEGH
ncbi:MAG: glycerophosphodiester phosphodiesterase [Gammaproteobacteria bacterium]|nr:glycerophosphodiester phosphodiesterase [Gammaproteobacteria bacterium]